MANIWLDIHHPCTLIRPRSYSPLQFGHTRLHVAALEEDTDILKELMFKTKVEVEYQVLEKDSIWRAGWMGFWVEALDQVTVMLDKSRQIKGWNGKYIVRYRGDK
jgi:hypothetical protein